LLPTEFMPTELPYSFPFLETATETLRAVAHPHRLLIVEMLYRQKSMNVTECTSGWA
jgi:hypothetical protein